MLKKDYILRQFEEFGKVLSLLMGLKKDREWEKFEKEIANAALKFISLEIKVIEQFSEALFEQEVMTNSSLTQEQKLVLATLLYEKMNYYVAMNDRDNYNALKNKCLWLYKNIKANFTENEFNLDVHYKIEFLSKTED